MSNVNWFRNEKPDGEFESRLASTQILRNMSLSSTEGSNDVRPPARQPSDTVSPLSNPEKSAK